MSTFTMAFGLVLCGAGMVAMAVFSYLVVRRSRSGVGSKDGIQPKSAQPQAPNSGRLIGQPSPTRIQDLAYLLNLATIGGAAGVVAAGQWANSVKFPGSIAFFVLLFVFSFMLLVLVLGSMSVLFSVLAYVASRDLCLVVLAFACCAPFVLLMLEVAVRGSSGWVEPLFWAAANLYGFLAVAFSVVWFTFRRKRYLRTKVR